MKKGSTIIVHKWSVMCIMGWISIMKILIFKYDSIRNVKTCSDEVPSRKLSLQLKLNAHFHKKTKRLYVFHFLLIICLPVFDGDGSIRDKYFDIRFWFQTKYCIFNFQFDSELQDMLMVEVTHLYDQPHPLPPKKNETSCTGPED